MTGKSRSSRVRLPKRGLSIVRCGSRMRKVFSHPVTPLFFGLCLRLLFVLRFPATSGDTVLYEQMAANWLKHGVYAMEVNGTMQPVDLRMPGYPAYLGLGYWLTGKAGEAARIGVLLR